MKKKKTSKKGQSTVREMKPSCCDEFHWIMMMHFPDVEPNCVEELSCSRCTDYKCGACDGENRSGWAVIECMKEKHMGPWYELSSGEEVDLEQEGTIH